jgi:hypothetical protein
VWLFLFPDSRWCFMEGDAMITSWFIQNCGTCLLGFKQCTLQKAFSGEAITGLAVWSPKEATLKRATLIRKGCCYGERNAVQKLFYCTTYMTQNKWRATHCPYYPMSALAYLYNPLTTRRVHWTRSKILSCIILIITCPRQAVLNEFVKFSYCNIYISLG